MKPTIIVTAANGFIGRKLCQFLKEDYNITALVRLPQPPTDGITFRIWDGKTIGDWAQDLEGALAVVNLAGKSVNCRYNEINKKAIFASRLDSTNVIGQAINNCITPPKVWLNAASATIYQHSLNEPNTEANGVIGHGFSVDVCMRWESCFFNHQIEGVRQVALRTAIVLGKNGGVMTPFRRLTRFGLGGRMGAGSQQFSWIHEDDFCRAVRFLIESETAEGTYNIAAPHPVRNECFMEMLRARMHIPFGLPQPKWLLGLGAQLIGTETELILKSRFVVPERLLDEGFKFHFDSMENCLIDLIPPTGNAKR